jgi:hypothetical protein
VDLRETNPNLYRSLMTVAAIFVALGLNFFIFTPTFLQYGIPKSVLAAGFSGIGLLYFVVLNLRRNLWMVRVLLIISTTAMVFWGWGTTETAFAGESSFQLAILYWGLAGIQVPLLKAPFFDPATANGNGRGK